MKNKNFLVKLLSKFDTSNYFFNFSLENQFSRNYGKGFWFLLSINILSLIIFILQLLLISDNDINNLAKFGSIGFYISGRETRLMLDILCCSIEVISLSFMAVYYHDNNEWLLSINSIYNEIRNNETDEKLQKMAEMLSKLFEKMQKFVTFFTLTAIFIIWTLRSDYLMSAPFGYLSSILICLLAIFFIFPLILRQNFICFFICFKYKILFRVLNQRLSRITVRNKNHLLSVHNRLCESVVKVNGFLGTVFMISVLIWSPNSCYGIYIIFYTQVNGIMPFFLITTLIVFELVFIALMFSIAYIDIEAKTSLNFVYGLGLKLKRKDQILDVIIALQETLKLIDIFLIFSDKTVFE